MQRLGACTGRMEEGALRVDANVSIRRPGDPLSTRTEIKNISSIRGVAGAVKHEIQRQTKVLETGGTITNETRAWDATSKITISMRDKEIVQDYRYMPEPNLPPLRVNLTTKIETQDVISVPLIQETIPILPEQSRLNLIKDYGLRQESAIQLVNEPILLEYFEQLMADKPRNPNKVINILTIELLSILYKRKIDIEDCPVTVEELRELTDLLLERKINLDVLIKVLENFVEEPQSGKSASDIVSENDWFLITDEETITKLCTEVLENNPKIVDQYKKGKVKVLKAFLGILVKTSKNKLDMSLASKKMEELLKK